MPSSSKNDEEERTFIFLHNSRVLLRPHRTTSLQTSFKSLKLNGFWRLITFSLHFSSGALADYPLNNEGSWRVPGNDGISDFRSHAFGPAPRARDLLRRRRRCSEVA
jgi:hypothetical protein